MLIIYVKIYCKYLSYSRISFIALLFSDIGLLLFRYSFYRFIESLNVRLVVGCVSVKFPRPEGDFVGKKYAIKSRCSSTFYQSCKGMFQSDCLHLYC